MEDETQAQEIDEGVRLHEPRLKLTQHGKSNIARAFILENMSLTSS